MIAVSSSGKSFRALAAYLANGRSGQEQDRVAWTASRNLPTADPELAATFMRATASQSDRIEKPVYHIALSFDPHDPVDRDTMERVAARVLDRLGLGEHQAMIVAHRDRGHAHVHLLVNRVHPETGKAWERWQDQPVIQQVLREEERSMGLREVMRSLPEPNSKEPASRVARMIEMLNVYDRVAQLTRERNAAQLVESAARLRAHELAMASEHARAADHSFVAALGGVYRDPKSAHEAFLNLVQTRGLSEATSTLRDHPERLGELRTVQRAGVFGLVGIADDYQARALARSAAVKARQTVEAHQAVHNNLGRTSSDRSESEQFERQLVSLKTALGRLPCRSDLEYRIRKGLERLLPYELQRLQTLAPAPQLTILKRLQGVARDVVLGREE